MVTGYLNHFASIGTAEIASRLCQFFPSEYWYTRISDLIESRCIPQYQLLNIGHIVRRQSMSYQLA